MINALRCLFLFAAVSLLIDARAQQVVVLDNALTSFDTTERRNVSIYESSDNQFVNSAKPATWRFYVYPTFFLLRDDKGLVNLAVEQSGVAMPLAPDSSGKPRSVQTVIFSATIFTLPDADRTAAVTALNSVYANNPVIASQMVAPLPVTSAKIYVRNADDRLDEQFPGTRFLSHLVDIGKSKPYFSVRWQIPLSGRGNRDDRVKALKAAFANYLTTSGLVLEPNFDVRTASTSQVKITASKIMSTNLANNLSGGGSDIMVARHEMDKFSKAIVEQLKITVREDPNARINPQDIVAVLTKNSSVQAIDDAKFDTLSREHMFDADDIKPSRIQHALNESFSLDKNDHTWKKKIDGSTSGSASFLGMGGSASFAASYSDEGLESALRQRGVKTDVSGDSIVVRSVDVSFIKVSLLSGSSDLIYTVTELSGTSSTLAGAIFEPFDKNLLAGSAPPPATAASPPVAAAASATPPVVSTSAAAAPAGR